MQRIMDSYPGDDKYIFPILTEGMDEDQVYKKIKSKTSTCSKNLKKLCLIAGLDVHLSTSVSRYSVNHYLTVNNIATRNQVSEIMVNSPKVNLGYFDSKEKKFEIQEKLGDIFGTTTLEQMKKASSGNQPEGSIVIQEEFDKLYDELTNDKAHNKISKEVKVAVLKELIPLLNDYSGLFERMSEGKKKELMDKAKNKKDPHL